MKVQVIGDECYRQGNDVEDVQRGNEGQRIMNDSECERAAADFRVWVKVRDGWRNERRYGRVRQGVL